MKILTDLKIQFEALYAVGMLQDAALAKEKAREHRYDTKKPKSFYIKEEI